MGLDEFLKQQSVEFVLNLEQIKQIAEEHRLYPSHS